MKILLCVFYTFLSFNLFCQSRIHYKKIDSSFSSKSYLIEVGSKHYQLTFIRDKDEVYDSVYLYNNKKPILRERINAGVSLELSQINTDLGPVILIESSSNVLTIHKIIFGRRIIFKRGSVMSKVEMRKYYFRKISS